MAVRDKGQARRPWFTDRTLSPSSFVSLVEPKPFERSPVAPQMELNSLESVGGYKGKGTWGLLGKPGGLQRSGGFVHCSGFESQELSPRRREGPEVLAQAEVARAALARQDCLEGVGAGWVGRGIAPGWSRLRAAGDGEVGLTWAAGAAGRGKSMNVQMRCHFIDDASGHFVQCWVVGRAFPHSGPKVPDPEDTPLFPQHPLYPGRGDEGQLRLRRRLGWG